LAYKRFVKETSREMPSVPDFNKGWNYEKMPIVNVKWDEALAYCKWAGGRLPTEAEWEYAARAGSTEVRYGALPEIAWYGENSAKRTHEVGQKRPNDFDLYDMLGNVSEWVNDWYDEKYYQNSPGVDPPGPLDGETRVMRGASWLCGPSDVRATFRYHVKPESPPHTDVGFRCVVEVFP
jgi:formylglycine-generating enzyme required for sulfatase activity